MSRGVKILLAQLSHPQYPLSNVPLAAGYLKAGASALRAPASNIEILNTSLPHFDLSDTCTLADEIAARRPTIVGMTVFIWNRLRTLDLCTRLKSLSPGTLIVVGGPEVAPRSIGEFFSAGVDAAVHGMGELVFVEMLNRISSGNRDFSGLTGVFTRDDGVSGTNRMATGPDYGSMPSPYILGYFDLERYNVIPFFTAQGCTAGCKYCSWGARGKLQAFPRERVIRELSIFQHLGDVSLYIMDSAFNVSPIFHDVCAAISQFRLSEGRRVECFADASTITSDHVVALASASMDNVEVGLQSTNPVALSAMGRPDNSRKILSSAEELARAGVPTCIDVILGLPGDSLSGFRATMEQLDGLPVGKHVFNLSVGPGTRFAAEHEKWQLERQPQTPYYLLGNASFGKKDVETAFLEYVDCSSDFENGYGDSLSYPQADIYPEIGARRRPVYAERDRFAQVIAFRGDRAVLGLLQGPDTRVSQFARMASHYVSLVFLEASAGGSARAAERLAGAILERDPHANVDIILDCSRDERQVPDAPLVRLCQRLAQRCPTFLDYRYHFLAQSGKVLRAGSVNVFLLVRPVRPISRVLANAVRVCWAVDVDSAADPESSLPGPCIAQSRYLHVDAGRPLTGGQILVVVAKAGMNASRYHYHFRDWAAQCVFDHRVRNVRQALSCRREVMAEGHSDMTSVDYSRDEIIRESMRL